MLNLPKLPPRIIPAFLLQDDAFVKTRKFARPLYVGDPLNTINLFNKFEVDEIIIFDISCSRNGKKPNFELIEELASECWVPLSYGGGIRTVNDIKRILNSGVEKVVIESLFYLSLNELEQSVKQFGSSSIAVCLNIKKTVFGRYVLYTLGKTKRAPISLEQTLDILNKIQIGEIVVNNISRDGTWWGYDCELLQYIASKSNCPVVALGGASCLNDLKNVILSGASAAAAGSLFVFQNKNRDGVLIYFPERNEIVRLFSE